MSEGRPTMTTDEENLAKGREQLQSVASELRGLAGRLAQIDRELGFEGLDFLHKVFMRLARDVEGFQPGPRADTKLVEAAAEKAGIPDAVMQQVLSSKAPRHRG